MVSIKLTDPIDIIEARINQAIADHINSVIARQKQRLIGKLKESVYSWVGSQPEIDSLRSEGLPNSLNSQFGLRGGQGDSVVASVITAVVESTEINIKKIDKKLKGSIDFNFQPKDFQNLLSLPDGHVVTEKGVDLHWLNWLLTRGDEAIVTNYQYVPSTDGRAGGGSMKAGGVFRVDPRFSGTTDNNFITRAFNGKQSEISKLISDIINV